MTKIQACQGLELIKRLKEVGLIPEDMPVNKVVIDVPCDGIVTLYVKEFPNRDILGVFDPQPALEVTVGHD